MPNVMVVDDEPDIRFLVRLTLEQAGHTVTEAASGEEALEMLDQEEPDLVLLDINLPLLNGFQVLEEMRLSGRLERVPVLILSANVSTAATDKALEAGSRGYISKPVFPAELRRVVAETLEQPASS